jgi:hypothetical protein
MRKMVERDSKQSDCPVFTDCPLNAGYFTDPLPLIHVHQLLLRLSQGSRHSDSYFTDEK